MPSMLDEPCVDVIGSLFHLVLIGRCDFSNMIRNLHNADLQAVVAEIWRNFVR